MLICPGFLNLVQFLVQDHFLKFHHSVSRSSLLPLVVDDGGVEEDKLSTDIVYSNGHADVDEESVMNSKSA